jgi:quercetin dioxygenase-like cupin family protein
LVNCDYCVFYEHFPLEIVILSAAKDLLFAHGGTCISRFINTLSESKAKDGGRAMTRRDLVTGAAAVLASGVAKAQTSATNLASGDLSGGAKVFAMGAIPDVKQPNGSSRKMVFDGKLATGEAISAHQSAAPAGTPAAPAHKIAHSEFIVVMEGTMEFVHDGKTDIAKAGDVIYVAYGTNHQVRNVGAGMARYLVFQMGGDTK